MVTFREGGVRFPHPGAETTPSVSPPRSRRHPSLPRSVLLGVAAARLLGPASPAQDLSDVLPILKTVPAPGAIVEGVRLSYYGSAGDLPKEDANKWDPAADTWTYATAPSGHGYTQVDVLGLSQGFAGLSVQAWIYSNWTGPLVPVRGGQRGLVCHAGGGDWWIHPLALAQLPETRSDELTVVRVVQTLDGVAHPAVRIQRTLPESRQAAVYDLATGLLLFKNAAVATGNTTYVSQMFYKGSRRIPQAGDNPPLPLWLKPGLQFQYQGRYTARTWGGTPFTLPLDARIEILTVSDRWFLYRQTTTLASLGGLPPTVEQSDLVGGGTLYLAPSRLASLTPGTVLDTDPVTGATLKVAAHGGSVTLVAEAGEASVTELTYDPGVGWMTAFRSRDSTDPLYSLESELTLDTLPDVTAPPRLAIRRDGGQVVLVCAEAVGITLESSTDGGRTWHPQGPIPGFWKGPIDPAQGCLLYRLRR